MLKQFKIGKSYATRITTVRSTRDFDCIFRITVAKRTVRSITTTQGKVLRILVVRSVEQVNPVGLYSKAPVITAANELTKSNHGGIEV
ncbi:hypothetical protein CCP4SC76_1690006 [Gammaproteobacteria bacterium]